jgi:kanamycin kinase
MSALAGPPSAPVTVPDAVRRYLDGRAFEVVWENERGGLTFKVGGPDGVHVKWSPAGCGIDLAAEAARLAWAGEFTRVPRVLELGEDDDGSWLVSASIDADNAVVTRWRHRPERAVAAIGSGLRALHDALPVATCPFRWSTGERRARAVARAGSGELNVDTWRSREGGLTLVAALETLALEPAAQPVVCHGDACAPNTLLDARGRCVAHVDLGCLGVGDLWADLAIAAWSATWNYGEGYEDALYEAYGVAADHERILYYRLLWELE